MNIKPIATTVVVLKVLLAAGYSSPTIAGGTNNLTCKLDDTPDYFIYYPTQLVFASEQFAIMQNFKGRVTTQIDLKTNQMLRTTFIGEPFEPDHQVLVGTCPKAAQVVEGWQTDLVEKNPLL